MKLIDKTFWKFILVGIINTLVGTGVMFLAYNLLHWSYWVSSASNYVCGSLVSYIINKRFTFQTRSRGPKTIIKFTVNITVCYLVAYGVAKPLMLKILSYASKTVQGNAAMLMGMCMFVFLNYLGQRFFVFREKTTSEAEKKIKLDQ